MKTFTKRIITAMLSMALLAMLCIPGFAADTASVSTDSTHTFELYQVFTGDVSNNKLTNVKWGQNANTSAADSAEAAAEALLDKEAKEAAAYVNYSSTPVATVSSGNSASVPSGYYIAKDVTTLNKGESYSDIIVKVVGADVVLSPKSNTAPNFNKKIYDVNDSKETLSGEMVKYDESGWQDSADYDIDDSVPMRLQGTVPTDITKYAHYYYAFHDVMEQGLTFEAIENVYVNDTVLPKDAYEVTTDGNKMNVIIKDLKPYAEADDTVNVYYTAKLNESAHNGSYGEVNEAWLEYSANPQDTTSPSDDEYPKDTNETEHDKVIVFTYNVVVNKVDTAGNALPGAEFELYKKMADGSEKKIELTKNADGTVFTAVGIDDGTYVLKETTPPDGYNAIEDTEFTVTAEHKSIWEAEERTTVLTSLAGGDLFTGEVSTGALTANVENKSGAELPTTGGTGTVLLYVLGGILVIGAGVLLVTKYRVSKEH